MLKCFRVSVCALAALWSSSALAQELPEAEQELLRLVNQEREREGLTKLEYEPRLRDSARRHTKRLAEEGKLSHHFPDESTPTERMADTGLHFDASAENVAAGDTVEELHVALMNSPGHRKNIMNPKYNAIGIGIRRSGDLLFATQNFVHKLDDVEVPEAEKIVLSEMEAMARKRGLTPKTAASDDLRGIACAMADNDSVNAQRALDSVAGARSVTTFTTNDPSDLPDELRSAVREVTFSNAGIGACFRRTARYPAGIYWMVAVLYR
jgi:hypothetical protein